MVVTQSGLYDHIDTRVLNVLTDEEVLIGSNRNIARHPWVSEANLSKDGSSIIFEVIDSSQSAASNENRDIVLATNILNSAGQQPGQSNSSISTDSGGGNLSWLIMLLIFILYIRIRLDGKVQSIHFSVFRVEC